MYCHEKEQSYLKDEDDCPIILLHGFCESSSLWNRQSEELSGDNRIICPDLPGFWKK